MDYSQLSDEDLLALKNNDYSKLSDEALLALKGQPTEQKPVSALEKIKSQLGQSTKRALDVVGYPDRKAGEYIVNARDTISPKKFQGTPSFVAQVLSPLSELAAGGDALVKGKGLQGIGEAMSNEYARPKDQAGDIASQIGASLLQPELMNAPIESVIQGAKTLGPPLGKAIAGLSSVGTAVKPKNYATVFNNPEAMLPGQMNKAKATYAAEATKLGIPQELNAEQLDRIKEPGKFAFEVGKRILAGEAVSPKEAQMAKISLNSVYPIPNKNNASYIRMLDQLKGKFESIVDSASTGMNTASKNYAIGKAGEAFKSLLPRTNSGQPGFVRGAAMGVNLFGGKPELSALGVPALAGYSTAAAGFLAKQLAKVANNDPAKKAILTALILGNSRKSQ